MKYALFFLVIEAQFFVEAVLLGGYFWIFAWPGVSFALVALAYLGLGPGVFGKQASGKLAWWSTLLLLPYLLLTWLTWRLVRRMSREDCYNEVAPGILVGAGQCRENCHPRFTARRFDRRIPQASVGPHRARVRCRSHA